MSTSPEPSTPSLSHKQFLKISRDYESAASAVNLIYVKDSEPGIKRIKKGTGFAYLSDNKKVNDKTQLERIRKLAIPPAWTEVWICSLDNGHIQATGLDLRKRKQYRYHNLWNLLRNETKFHRLFEFGKALPALREELEKDLAARELNEAKVIATVISLMERTYIRIGNNGYEKIYGSYGLTTLKDRHVQIQGDQVKFSFKGKKGIEHNITLKNKRLARTVKACRDIPGKELFQYYGADGQRRSIDSGMVNGYIHRATCNDFTAKDFRTWAGSVHALQTFLSFGEAVTDKDVKQNVIATLDAVSKKLGNTRTVCKKYYVHPGLIRLYEENRFESYTKELDKIEEPSVPTDLTREERLLMRILQDLVKQTSAS